MFESLLIRSLNTFVQSNGSFCLCSCLSHLVLVDLIGFGLRIKFKDRKTLYSIKSPTFDAESEEVG